MAEVNFDLIAEFNKAADLSNREDKVGLYAPYDFQYAFHAAGADHQERMLMAANRVGKTMSAACETSFHLTGEYPNPGEHFFKDTHLLVKLGLRETGDDMWPHGWPGRRFEQPVLAWTGSPTNETSRDIVQNELLGGLSEDLGTGAIPKHRIVGKPALRQAGVKNVVDSFEVRHVSGGLSKCVMKTYEQGWQKWQGTAPHVVWLDEEPDDYMIFSEAQTRILSSRGIMLVTFTPLLGVTELVEHFQQGGKGIYLKTATWDDVEHLSREDRDRLANSYRAHEREARTKGIPMMGEGAVFPIADRDIQINAADLGKIPDHWARIKGCDFGIDHPAAGVELAWDRDADVIYVIDCYKKANELSPYHAAWLKKGPVSIPVAWPHDGMNREKSGGNTLADAYRAHGANMLPKSARYKKARGEKKEKGGPQPVEPIVDEMLERMQTGKLKVFTHLSEWFEEKRSYHRKDGKIVDRRDDILKATMYAIMMKRYAASVSQLRGGYHRKVEYMGTSTGL